jgi:hypothetical protein
MPLWCTGIHCGKHPELGLHGGHGGIKNCPDCGENIHDPCAIVDEDAGLSKMNVYTDCWGARKPPAEREEVEEEEQEEREQMEEQEEQEEREQMEEPEARRSAVKKERNSLVSDQFIILHGSFSGVGSFRCMHCDEKTYVLNTWNW